MILITTPDYLPQVGGLTTFTLNLEKCLKELNIEYKVFHWKSVNELFSLDLNQFKEITTVINVHFMFAAITKFKVSQSINFIHGSEILFYSPNWLKNIFKKIKKNEYLKVLEKSLYNIGVSQFSLDLLAKQGFSLNYSRDLVFHNCILTTDSTFISKTINEETIKFCSICRDVPHKNIAGVIKFCEIFSDLTHKKVELFLAKKKHYSSTKIIIKEPKESSDSEITKIYQACHFNLLLSLDHSHLGNVEGFGLTILEAAKYGTPSIGLNFGGLKESIHDQETGWLVDDINRNEISKLVKNLNQESYATLSNTAYNHTIQSHSLNRFKEFLVKLL